LTVLKSNIHSDMLSKDHILKYKTANLLHLSLSKVEEVYDVV